MCSTRLSFTIPRHCVSSGQDGLSPLQKILLEDPSPVRVASAPTGAGKSHAFLRAAQTGKRVLFVAPTRRLAQNLAASLVESLKDGGCEEAVAQSRVALWTSDERKRLKDENPGIHVGRLRIRQLRDLEARQAGDIIIATPESVAWLLVRPAFAGVGAAPVGLHDPIREFDHVVFDEFHTIDARGFGLAASIARVAATVGGEGARVTFLSATPIDIVEVLTAFGVPREGIAVCAETVMTGRPEATGAARALHGDVRIAFEEAATIADLVERHESDVAACLARGRQVVVIADALRDLLPAKLQLAAFFDRVGAPFERRLSINSTDDGGTGGEGDGLFTIGRYADPLDFDVLIATSSVEIGVTFRAGLILMDPGHNPLSFVQRIGRVARGDEPGQAFVRLTRARCDREEWLRKLILRLEKEAAGDGCVPVERFAAAAMLTETSRFKASGGLTSGDDVPTTFRSMPMRAVWCSALFWVVLERAGRATTGMRRTLESFRPSQARLIHALLEQLRNSPLHSARTWAKAFENESLRLRLIQPHVLIREPGRTRPLAWNIYASYQELVSAPTVSDDDDNLVVLVERSLEDILSRSDRIWIDGMMDALVPDQGGVVQVRRRDPAGDWLNRAEKKARSGAGLEAQRRALDAAIRLVRLSLIVPAPEDQVTPAGASSYIQG